MIPSFISPHLLTHYLLKQILCDLYEWIKAVEIKNSIVFNLVFANNTILSCFLFFFLINAGCPLNSNQQNDKKMTNFFVKIKKKKQKIKKMSQKMPKNKTKHCESQVGDKLVSVHNKYGTLAYFITNNLHVL